MASTISAGTTTTTSLSFSGDTSGVLQLQTNGTTTAVTIDTSQNVGIAVTPSSGTGWSNGQMEFPSGSNIVSQGNNISFGQNYYYNSAYKYKTSTAAAYFEISQGTYQWYIAPSGTAGNTITFTQAMTLDTSNNLLLGTTSKSYGNGTTLEVSGASQGTLTISNGATPRMYLLATSSESRVASYGTTPLTFFGNGNEYARIDTSGNLLVGATSQFGNCKVGIKDTSVTYNLLTIQDTATSGYGQYVYFTNSSGSQAGLIAHATSTTVLYTASSDRRLKTNIADITTEQSGPIIDALKPRSFNWSEDNIADVGFIADEFQTVIPRAVVGQPNAVDSEGKPKYQSIEASSSEMIAYLVAEIQSLRARLKAANIA
jgi:hypothetical protein